MLFKTAKYVLCELNPNRYMMSFSSFDILSMCWSVDTANRKAVSWRIVTIVWKFFKSLAKEEYFYSLNRMRWRLKNQTIEETYSILDIYIDVSISYLPYSILDIYIDAALITTKLQAVDWPSSERVCTV